MAFQAATGGSTSVYVIRSDGRAPRRVVAGQPSGWSQDTKWIYFSSNPEGSHEVWKTPANGAEPVQVTKNGGKMGIESRDGRFLYYKKTASGITSLWRAPIEGGEEVRILDALDDRYFAVTERGIYFFSEAKRVQFYSLATRKVQTVAELPRPTWARGLTVSPDGRHLLYSLHEQHDCDLMLVQNFR